MPLTLPTLDDRRFDDLMAEAKALIPSLAPGWTDHNAADPGITLLELFAWLSETLMYRIDLVPPASTRVFLRLLNKPDWRPSADLAVDIRTTVQEMRRCDRAVTAADFETLAHAADPRVARAHCVPRRELTENRRAEMPAHVSVVVLPADGGEPPPDLLDAVATYLEPRRLITTRVHVVAPRTVEVGVRATLTLRADAVAAAVRAAALAALARYLDPLAGGDDAAGWPFGRPVYVSEITRLLAAVPGVDFVEPVGADSMLTTPDSARLIANPSGELIGVRLDPDELPVPAADPAGLVTAYPPTPRRTA